MNFSLFAPVLFRVLSEIFPKIVQKSRSKVLKALSCTLCAPDKALPQALEMGTARALASNDGGKLAAGACTRIRGTSPEALCRALSNNSLASMRLEDSRGSCLSRDWASSPSLTSPASDKTSVIAQLRPLLQPRLSEDGLTWDEVAPLISKMHVLVLHTAVATANVQPVLVKLKAAAYQKPAMKKVGSSQNLRHTLLLAQMEPVLLPALEQMGLSWDDALPELKQMTEADLQSCLTSGGVPPSIEKLAKSRSAATTPTHSRPSSGLELTASNQDAKASIIAQLRPLLSPLLRRDGLTWNEASPILSKMPNVFLETAVATANLQPVLSKLKTAAYQEPALKKLGSSQNLLQKILIAELEPALRAPVEQMGLSWDDALCKLKEMPVADLEKCLRSGSVAPFTEQLNKSFSAAEQQRAKVRRIQEDEKTSVLVQLRPLMLERLHEDGLTWDEVAPLLAKLNIDFLRKAIATSNVQVVLAKLKAAAYKKPEMRKLGSSENRLENMFLTLGPSPLKSSSSCPASLFRLVTEDVSDDEFISASGAQKILRLTGFDEGSSKDILADLTSHIQQPANPPTEDLTEDLSDVSLISASDDVYDDDLIDASDVLKILHSYGFDSGSIEDILSDLKSEERQSLAMYISPSSQAAII
jgi:hypothetical protein